MGEEMKILLPFFWIFLVCGGRRNRALRAALIVAAVEADGGRIGDGAEGGFGGIGHGGISCLAVFLTTFLDCA
jgi:hypothetical protein